MQDNKFSHISHGSRNGGKVTCQLREDVEFANNVLTFDSVIQKRINLEREFPVNRTQSGIGAWGGDASL